MADHTNWWIFGGTGARILSVGMKNGISTLQKIDSFFKKLNLHLPYNPVILLLAICPRERKAYVYTKTWTQIFIAT
jgi:cyclopropane fatty-acyl-phospholipid synthase-like methyltransferase